MGWFPNSNATAGLWSLFGLPGGFRFGRDDGRGGRFHRLHEAGRRQHVRDRLRRLECLLTGRGALPALGGRHLSEDVAGRQLDVALLRQAIDELARDDLLDGARGALYLNAVIALEQRRHFLARRPEQLRDLVNPDC